MPEEIWPALLPQSNLPSGRAGGVNHPPDCVGQPKGVEAPGVDDDEELQEAGRWGNEGPQHRRCQGPGSGHHPGRRRGCLLRPRPVCSRGRGAQGGLHLLENAINAPRGVGSRRCRQWRRRVQSRTPEGQSTGGPWGCAACLALPRRANA
jgi:hypothetical protein